MKFSKYLVIAFLFIAPIITGIIYLLLWTGTTFGFDSMVGKGPQEASPLVYSVHTALVVFGPLVGIILEVLNIRAVMKNQLKKAALMTLAFIVFTPFYLLILTGLVQAA